MLTTVWESEMGTATTNIEGEDKYGSADCDKDGIKYYDPNE